MQSREVTRWQFLLVPFFVENELYSNTQFSFLLKLSVTHTWIYCIILFTLFSKNTAGSHNFFFLSQTNAVSLYFAYHSYLELSNLTILISMYKLLCNQVTVAIVMVFVECIYISVLI